MTRPMFLENARLLSLAEFNSIKIRRPDLLPLTGTKAWLQAESSLTVPVFTHTEENGLQTAYLAPSDYANVFPVLEFNGLASGFGLSIGEKIQFPFGECHYSLTVVSENLAICSECIGYASGADAPERTKAWFSQYHDIINKSKDYSESDGGQELLAELKSLIAQTKNDLLAAHMEEIRQTIEMVQDYYVTDLSVSIASTKHMFRVMLPEMVQLARDYVKYQEIRKSSKEVDKQLDEIEKTFSYLKAECKEIKERAVEWKGMEIKSSIAILKQSLSDWKK